jgi:hypothetical protein
MGNGKERVPNAKGDRKSDQSKQLYQQQPTNFSNSLNFTKSGLINNTQNP